MRKSSRRRRLRSNVTRWDGPRNKWRTQTNVAGTERAKIRFVVRKKSASARWRQAGARLLTVENRCELFVPRCHLQISLFANAQSCEQQFRQRVLLCATATVAPSRNKCTQASHPPKCVQVCKGVESGVRKLKFHLLKWSNNERTHKSDTLRVSPCN